MPREDEAAILDSARVHHSRLTQALERGSGAGRSRPVPVRMVASLVIAALACAGCVGYSFISTHLDSIRQTRTPISNPPVQPAPESTDTEPYPAQNQPPDQPTPEVQPEEEYSSTEPPPPLPSDDRSPAVPSGQNTGSAMNRE